MSVSRSWSLIEKVYIGGGIASFVPLTLGNLKTGLDFEAKSHYDVVSGEKIAAIAGVSIHKSLCYSAVWPVFWSYATLRSILCKPVMLDVGIGKPVNANGILPHFIYEFNARKDNVLSKRARLS